MANKFLPYKKKRGLPLLSKKNAKLKAFCANEICHKIHDKCHNDSGSHADEGQPRPAKDAAEDGFHAKRWDSLEQDEASHTAKHCDNHNPGA